MGYQVRPADGVDAHHILDIDIKCFDDPWPADLWSEGMEVSVATHYGTPIGLVAYRLVEETEVAFVSLLKLAVKQPYRRSGVSKLLMDEVFQFARDWSAEHIMLTVPESLCCDIAGWLAKTGFQSVGIDEGAFESYGEVEDGFIFMLEKQ